MPHGRAFQCIAHAVHQSKMDKIMFYVCIYTPHSIVCVCVFAYALHYACCMQFYFALCCDASLSLLNHFRDISNSISRES